MPWAIVFAAALAMDLLICFMTQYQSTLVATLDPAQAGNLALQ